MSLLPIVLDINDYLFDPWARLRSDYGLGAHPRQLRQLLLLPNLLQQVQKAKKESVSPSTTPTTRIIGKDGFQVTLDVRQFVANPEELKVRIVDRDVIVEGQHEEREDEHGFILRHFVRKYRIPEEIDLDELTSSLSSDGVLSIKAPLKKAAVAENNERVIQIEHTGPTKEAIQEEKKDEKREE